MRIVALATALMALTACFEFTGSSKTLGFSSDATLDGFQPWTPETPLAAGARPRVGVTEVLATGKEPRGEVSYTGRGMVLEGEGVRLAHRRRAIVEATTDGFADSFRATWREAERVEVLDPVSALLGEYDPLERIVVLVDADAPIGVRLSDARGRPLGWVPEQLSARGTDLEVMFEDHLSLRAQTSGQARLEIAWDLVRRTIEVEAVEVDAIDYVFIEEDDLNGDCVLRATGMAGDEPVMGLEGLEWSHTTEAGPLVPCTEAETRVLLRGRQLEIRS